MARYTICNVHCHAAEANSHRLLHRWILLSIPRPSWCVESSRVESNRTRYSRSYGAQADPSKFPKCPQGCSSIARPNILMFNDSDWTRTRTAAQSDRLVDWYSSLVATQTPCVVIEVGAGTSVPTVRYQSELLSRVPGSYIVRINAREPQIPHNRKGFELPMSALVRECQCVSRE